MKEGKSREMNRIGPNQRHGEWKGQNNPKGLGYHDSGQVYNQVHVLCEKKEIET